MTDERSNLFAKATTVTQLFDALWYHATQCVTFNDLGQRLHSRRDREIAIADAHKRYAEISSDAVD